MKRRGRLCARSSLGRSTREHTGNFTIRSFYYTTVWPHMTPNNRMRAPEARTGLTFFSFDRLPGPLTTHRNNSPFVGNTWPTEVDLFFYFGDSISRPKAFLFWRRRKALTCTDNCIAFSFIIFLRLEIMIYENVIRTKRLIENAINLKSKDSKGKSKTSERSESCGKQNTSR